MVGLGAGSKSKYAENQRHRSHSLRNPDGFHSSGLLKSCLGEHDFSSDFLHIFSKILHPAPKIARLLGQASRFRSMRDVCGGCSG